LTWDNEQPAATAISLCGFRSDSMQVIESRCDGVSAFGIVDDHSLLRSRALKTRILILTASERVGTGESRSQEARPFAESTIGP